MYIVRHAPPHVSYSTISMKLHVMAFLPLCKAFVTKNDRLLEIKTLFSRTKELKTKGSSQCEELFIVLEDSVFTAYFHRKQSPLVIYFIFADQKSERIYLLAKTSFLFRNENRRLSNTYLKFIFLHI